MPYLTKTGGYTPYPTTKDKAISVKSSRYDDGDKCDDCGVASIKFVADDSCIHCSLLDALDSYNEAVSLGLPLTKDSAMERGEDKYCVPEMCETYGHSGVRTLKGKCYICEQLNVNPRAIARREGLNWYIPNEPCINGHMSPRSVVGNTCRECKAAASTRVQCPARASARKQGLANYAPSSPCVKGHLSSRRVVDDLCYECRAGNRVDATAHGRTCAATKAVMANVDMILSKGDAKTLGLKAYRTGDECRRGHRGWRYVSTGSCIDCLNS